MPDGSPGQFDNVSVICKANVFFDGGVVSHTVLFGDGTKKTLGLIRPGSYRFDTQVREVMAITAGQCRARLPGSGDWRTYTAGQSFEVAAGKAFDIAVDEGLCQYVCSFG
jgi:uncharacterized protein YaiE (UPF0345 family)